MRRVLKRLASFGSVTDLAFNIGAILVTLGIWYLASRLVTSVFFPKVSDTLQALRELAVRGDLEGYTLARHIGVSAIRVGSGFLLALVMGMPLGLLMGLYKPLYDRTRIVVEPIRFIPPIAWIPLTIVLLSGFSRYVFLIWLAAFFPIFINTLVSVPRVEPVWINVFKVYGAGRMEIIRKAIVPGILPDVVGGMRVSLGSSWMCIVAAEMIGGETVGLGRLILKYAELMRIPEVVVGMFLIGCLGFGLNEVLLYLERRLFKWRWTVHI